jgi:hypothetical protein
MFWFKLKCTSEEYFTQRRKVAKKQNLDFFISAALVIVSPKEICMAKKHGEYLANDPDYVPDPEIEEFMELEISRAPKDPELLAHRLRNNTAASPRDAGGDLDADWEDVNASGSETVAGDNPTPDQSLVEENASAMGVSYEDNEELEFIDKIEKRDRERYELDENSKASEDMI